MRRPECARHHADGYCFRLPRREYRRGMTTPPPRDPSFGHCVCGGRFERRQVAVRMKGAGGFTTLPDVPQGLCPLCGSRVYRARTLELIELVMRDDRTDHDQETRATG